MLIKELTLFILPQKVLRPTADLMEHTYSVKYQQVPAEVPLLP